MSEEQAKYKVPTLTKEQIQWEIVRLVDMELARSYDLGHRQFNSTHEGYAVMKEEIEETRDEARNLVMHSDAFWSAVKRDEYDICECVARDIYETARKTAYEAIQAGAMARKYLVSLGRGVDWEDVLGR